MPPAPDRRRFRFGIRAMFVLVTVMAICAGVSATYPVITTSGGGTGGTPVPGKLVLVHDGTQVHKRPPRTQEIIVRLAFTSTIVVWAGLTWVVLRSAMSRR
jgi:hypothetical protein